MIIVNIPGVKLWLCCVGFTVEDWVVLWAVVPISVVNSVAPTVVDFTVVVGGSCVAVTFVISVVALLSSVLGVVDTRTVVFGVVISLAVVASLVVTIVTFEWSDVSTVKWNVMTSWDAVVIVERFGANWSVVKVSCVLVWSTAVGVDFFAVKVRNY